MRQEALPSTSTPTSPPQQRQVTVKRRDSARRHTLANGVDYNMVTHGLLVLSCYCIFSNPFHIKNLTEELEENSDIYIISLS